MVLPRECLQHHYIKVQYSQREESARWKLLKEDLNVTKAGLALACIVPKEGGFFGIAFFGAINSHFVRVGTSKEGLTLSSKELLTMVVTYYFFANVAMQSTVSMRGVSKIEEGVGGGSKCNKGRSCLACMVVS